MSQNKFSTYLTLPASANKDVFPDNSLSNYKVKLKNRLSLQDGQYEVALVDLIYSCDFYNVDDGKIVLNYHPRPQGRPRVMELDIGAGKVRTAKELVDRINDMASKNWSDRGDIFRVSYNAYDNKSTLQVLHAKYYVILPKAIALMLGFNPNKRYGEGTHHPSSPSDVRSGFRMIYVYTDIVEPSPVGDTMVQLLRVDPLTFDSDSSDARIRVVNRQYVRTRSVNTDTISIVLASDTGDYIPFRSGEVSVHLHIRQI